MAWGRDARGARRRVDVAAGRRPSGCGIAGPCDRHDQPRRHAASGPATRGPRRIARPRQPNRCARCVCSIIRPLPPPSRAGLWHCPWCAWAAWWQPAPPTRSQRGLRILRSDPGPLSSAGHPRDLPCFRITARMDAACKGTAAIACVLLWRSVGAVGEPEMGGNRALVTSSGLRHRQHARLPSAPTGDLELATQKPAAELHRADPAQVPQSRQRDGDARARRHSAGAARRARLPEARRERAPARRAPCACDAAYVCANGQMFAHQTLSDFAASVAPGARRRAAWARRAAPPGRARAVAQTARGFPRARRALRVGRHVLRAGPRACGAAAAAARAAHARPLRGWLKPRYSISRGYDFDSYEYTLVMSGMLAPHSAGTSRRLAERTRVARRNLERWVDAVGVTEAMDAFVVLMAFTLGWPPHAFGCYSLRNVGPPAPTRHANQSARAERRVAASGAQSARAAGCTRGCATKSRCGRVPWSARTRAHLRPSVASS